MKGAFVAKSATKSAFIADVVPGEGVSGRVSRARGAGREVGSSV